MKEKKFEEYWMSKDMKWVRKLRLEFIQVFNDRASPDFPEQTPAHIEGIMLYVMSYEELWQMHMDLGNDEDYIISYDPDGYFYLVDEEGDPL